MCYIKINYNKKKYFSNFLLHLFNWIMFIIFNYIFFYYILCMQYITNTVSNVYYIYYTRVDLYFNVIHIMSSKIYYHDQKKKICVCARKKSLWCYFSFIQIRFNKVFLFLWLICVYVCCVYSMKIYAYGIFIYYFLENRSRLEWNETWWCQSIEIEYRFGVEIPTYC